MSRYEISGRTVLLTGSTGGLGTAVATELRARGARLALLDLDEAAVEAQAIALGGPGVAHGFVVDVRSMDSITAAVDAAAEYFGGIDIVIANAGIEVTAPMEIATEESFERVIDINVLGVWRTFKAALPHVRAASGYLQAISSMAAFIHSPMHASYTSSKAAIWAMCDSLRLELRHQGVAVGSVHPTFFSTPMMDAVHRDPAGVALWNGNKGLIWGMVPIDSVVGGVISGIRGRRAIVVVPRRLTIVAKAAGYSRRIVERLGFNDRQIAEAVWLAEQHPTSDRSK
ncbi:SDR family NAD(P)-dependent oxidoreductase [Williamsia sp. CHRR-6]|uniref:SDR family NAD(P)-dependent oxidoreductase n=1 Tax=Williamsia sp. CHRR-6 TaxID=2835871 RepID=UPI001BDAC4F8|nr:SDR family NAD(P)-dependent oxidoreductase [Williamsia sp. CHRR-6]MBT0566025.1 SDR family NAD(P)-dependent oxidoreductase [Williamsia sp. CHRR-6]